MLSRLALRSAAARLPVLARAQSSAASSGIVHRKERPIDPAPVRHGFIPEEWFQLFYNKTGYTGPYMFAFGLSTYLVSKEIYVLEHEFFTGVAALIVCIGIVKKLGPPMTKYLDEQLDQHENSLDATRTDEIKIYEEAIENEKKQQWRTEAQQMIMDAKKANIAMQLEGTYRERLHKVFSEVKKRLDYQLQVSHVERRIAQKHMSDWIIKNVLKSITPEQEKAALQQCITELQGLAPRA